MDGQFWIAFATLSFTIFATVFGGFWNFLGRLNALADKASADLADARDELGKEIQRLRDQDSAARHNLAGGVQKTISEIEMEQRRMRDNAATKAEMVAMEGRINMAIGKMETRLDRIEGRLEPLPAMHAIMTNLVASVDRLSVAVGVRRPPS
jgi:hypothetical protein